MLVLTAIVLAIWIYLCFFHGRFWRLADIQLPAATPSGDKIRIAAIVPARNEAEVIGGSLGSLLRQSFTGELHVLLVDDNSTDGTGNVARAAADALGGADKLTVIPVSEPPSGWTGKLWAMQQGWEATRTLKPDLLLLTDADVEHAPDNLVRLIAQMDHQTCDLVSVMVKLRCVTLAERLLIPAFVYFFFLLYPPARVADPRSSVAAAAGGCMLVRREALERIGGFAEIRGEIIDDCSLARKIKNSRGRLWLGVTSQTHSVRGYDTFSGIRNMIARSAFNQLHHSLLRLLVCIAGMFLIFVSPLALVFYNHGVRVWIAFAACGVMFATYLPLLRLYRIIPLAAVTLPFAALFYMYATLYSAKNYWRGRGGEWKGRAQDRSGGGGSYEQNHLR